MKVIDGKNFLFHESGGVPKDSEDDLARAFIRAIAKLKLGPKATAFMGGPNPSGKILAAEPRQLADGTPYFLVRAATKEEGETPGW